MPNILRKLNLQKNITTITNTTIITTTNTITITTTTTITNTTTTTTTTSIILYLLYQSSIFSDQYLINKKNMGFIFL